MKLRISISRKNKQSGEYEQDFSGFVNAIGTAAAKKAACLKEGDTIKLGDVDVTNKYDKEKNITYTNFAVFSFDLDGEDGAQNQGRGQQTQVASAHNGFEFVPMDGIEDGDLPF